VQNPALAQLSANKATVRFLTRTSAFGRLRKVRLDCKIGSADTSFFGRDQLFKGISSGER
jgi:hypothetical protein